MFNEYRDKAGNLPSFYELKLGAQTHLFGQITSYIILVQMQDVGYNSSKDEIAFLKNALAEMKDAKMKLDEKGISAKYQEALQKAMDIQKEKEEDTIPEFKIK